MTATALLATTPNPTDEEIDPVMNGNLCRSRALSERGSGSGNESLIACHPVAQPAELSTPGVGEAIGSPARRTIRSGPGPYHRLDRFPRTVTFNCTAAQNTSFLARPLRIWQRCSTPASLSESIGVELSTCRELLPSTRWREARGNWNCETALV
jgi:hypothetical protein